ncbi:hypothetical protein EC988_010414, partial [Linderina pennispora]
MVSVRGIPRPLLESLIIKCNQHSTQQSDNVYLAIVNGYDNFIVTGRTTAVVQFVRMVRACCANPDDDQSRIPPSQRRPVVSTSFLNINLVGHCELLQESADWVYPAVVEEGWRYTTDDLNIA